MLKRIGGVCSQVAFNRRVCRIDLNDNAAIGLDVDLCALGGADWHGDNADRWLIFFLISNGDAGDGHKIRAFSDEFGLHSNFSTT